MKLDISFIYFYLVEKLDNQIHMNCNVYIVVTRGDYMDKKEKIKCQH